MTIKKIMISDDEGRNWDMASIYEWLEKVEGFVTNNTVMLSPFYIVKEFAKSPEIFHDQLVAYFFRWKPFELTEEMYEEIKKYYTKIYGTEILPSFIRHIYSLKELTAWSLEQRYGIPYNQYIELSNTYCSLLPKQGEFNVENYKKYNNLMEIQQKIIMEFKRKPFIPIRFYRTKDNYGFLSNFFLSPFVLDNKKWKTVEHYFQAQKFTNVVYQEKIRDIESPMAAADLGRSRNHIIREDWDQVRNNIMYKALNAKFGQNEDLKQLLINTDDALLIEHTYNDRYWADGGDGSGFNYLGVLLMNVRDTLRNNTI